MNKKLTLTMAGALSLALLLTGCGSKADERVVNVCSWGEYIDESLITQFEEETGIRVNYQTTDSNETLYTLLKTDGANYDVIVPSDYMISQLIEEDMLAEIDFDNVPNYALIGDEFKNQPYDPDNLYSVPYTWGTLGMIYNPNMTEMELTDWMSMFDTTDTAYHGETLMIRNPRDAFGIALMALGYSVNTVDEAEIQEAYQLMADAKASGTYQSFVMDEVYGKMESGESALSAYYAGDYLTMLESNEDLVYVVPETGSNWFIDGMCILKDADNKTEAEEWINFLCSTEASLANMDYIWYASPNAEALEQYPDFYAEEYGEELDMELYEIMAPSADVLAHCEAYLVLPTDILTLYNDLWVALGTQ